MKSKKIRVGLTILPIVILASSACAIKPNTQPMSNLESPSNWSQQISAKSSNRSYSLFIGNNEQVFSREADLLNYVEKTFLTTDFYTKQANFVNNHFTSEVSEDAILSVANNPLVTIFKKADGSSTYALSDDLQNVQKARDEAALSYLEIHNLYQFNDHYFDNFNDIENYILHLSDTKLNALIQGQDTGMKMLSLKNGVVKTFQKFSDIKASLAYYAEPFYRNQQNALIPINQANLVALGQSLASEDLQFVPITSNDGKITQVVDMDASTPNGNFYGQYLTTSGIGMEGIYDHANWKVVSEQTSLVQSVASFEEQTLQAFADYILLINKVQITDLINQVKVSSQDDDLKTFLIRTSQNVNYAALLDEFLLKLSQGVRYNALNALILSRSFLIDKMVQNRESVSIINKLNSYYHAMAMALDHFLATTLAAIFIDDVKQEEFALDYFQRGFNFINEKHQPDLSFTNLPSSYYRALMGLNGHHNQRSIFQLIKSFLGGLGLFVNDTTRAQKYVDEKLSSLIKSAKAMPEDNNAADVLWATNRTALNNFSVATNGFQFLGQNASATSQEYQAVWAHLTSEKMTPIQFQVRVNDLAITRSIVPSKLLSQFQTYLTNEQGHLYGTILAIIDENVAKFNEQLKTHTTFATQRDFLNTSAAKTFLELNIQHFLLENFGLAIKRLPLDALARDQVIKASIDELYPSQLAMFNQVLNRALVPLSTTLMGISFVGLGAKMWQQVHSKPTFANEQNQGTLLPTDKITSDDSATNHQPSIPTSEIDNGPHYGVIDFTNEPWFNKPPTDEKLPPASIDVVNELVVMMNHEQEWTFNPNDLRPNGVEASTDQGQNNLTISAGNQRPPYAFDETLNAPINLYVSAPMGNDGIPRFVLTNEINAKALTLHDITSQRQDGTQIFEVNLNGSTYVFKNDINHLWEVEIPQFGASLYDFFNTISVRSKAGFFDMNAYHQFMSKYDASLWKYRFLEIVNQAEYTPRNVKMLIDFAAIFDIALLHSEENGEINEMDAYINQFQFQYRTREDLARTLARQTERTSNLPESGMNVPAVTEPDVPRQTITIEMNLILNADGSWTVTSGSEHGQATSVSSSSSSDSDTPSYPLSYFHTEDIPPSYESFGTNLEQQMTKFLDKNGLTILPYDGDKIPIVLNENPDLNQEMISTNPAFYRNLRSLQEHVSLFEADGQRQGIIFEMAASHFAKLQTNQGWIRTAYEVTNYILPGIELWYDGAFAVDPMHALLSDNNRQIILQNLQNDYSGMQSLFKIANSDEFFLARWANHRLRMLLSNVLFDLNDIPVNLHGVEFFSVLKEHARLTSADWNQLASNTLTYLRTLEPNEIGSMIGNSFDETLRFDADELSEVMLTIARGGVTKFPTLEVALDQYEIALIEHDSTNLRHGSSTSSGSYYIETVVLSESESESDEHVSDNEQVLRGLNALASSNSASQSSSALEALSSDGAQAALGALNMTSTILNAVGVIPILGGLGLALGGVVQLVNGFASEKLLPYEYQTKEGKSFFWDGSKLESSFWGLKNDIQYTIRDLKILVTNVISPYTANQAGIYYEGKFYQDTFAVRHDQARALVEFVSNFHKDNEAEWQKVWQNVVWKLPLADQDISPSFNSLAALLENIENQQASLTSNVKTIYHTFFASSITDNILTLRESLIVSLKNQLKKSLVMRLPSLNANLEVTSEPFVLPRPSYQQGKLLSVPESTDIIAYQDYLAKRARTIIIDANLDLVQGPIDLQTLQKTLLKQFQITINVPEKTVTLDQVRLELAFDRLRAYDRNDLLMVTSFIDHTGKKRFFTSQDQALRIIFNANNLQVVQND